MLEVLLPLFLYLSDMMLCANLPPLSDLSVGSSSPELFQLLMRFLPPAWKPEVLSECFVAPFQPSEDDNGEKGTGGR